MDTLDSIAKRDLLASPKANPKELREHAEEFMRQERFGDAFEFFRKIGDTKGITRVKDAAVKIADVELLWRIEARAPGIVGKDDWRSCASYAQDAGKLRSAAFAYRRIGDDARAEAAEGKSKAS